MNQAPVVTIGHPRPEGPVPSNTKFFTISGQPGDPDGDEDPNVLCVDAGAVADGPCRATLSLCGGVADGFDIDIIVGEGPGKCVVTAWATDSWGARGEDRIEFEVLPP